MKTCSAALEKESGADMKIYNVGSVNVDHVYQVPHFVRAGETLASASLQQFPGGKGLNQSVALGKAGANVRHCALLNAADTWLIDVLREAKVDVSRIHTVSEPTGHAIIQVDETGQNCILLYPGANHCFTSSHFAQALADAKEGDILLLQNEINGLAELFTLAHSKGMQIAWNPSPFDRSLLDLPLEYVTWPKQSISGIFHQDTKTNCQYYIPSHYRKGFYKGHPNSILVWLYKAQKRLGIPRFSLHYFRHYYASKMATITDEATVLELGGWKTDHVFKSAYRYALPENVDKAKEDASKLIQNLM